MCVGSVLSGMEQRGVPPAGSEDWIDQRCSQVLMTLLSTRV